MPLQVIIVGAGVAGLCAAVALKQAGHRVQVFEKSQSVGEFGAAVVLSPNSSSVLARLGFSFSRARACRLNSWETVDGITLNTIGCVDQSDCEQRYGMPLMGVHRVDLQNELMRLACQNSWQGSASGAVEVRCGVKVERILPEEGYIQLEDGTHHFGDLIVAADGLYSVARAAVVGANGSTPKHSGFSAFRFLIPTQMIKENAEFDEVLTWKPDGITVLVDTHDKLKERHMAWYECQDGAVQNLVGNHPSEVMAKSEDVNLNRELMVQEFGHFHPDIVKLIKIAPEIRSWPLMNIEPLRTWSKGNVLLVGDAAHAMLPFGGQGANQALEDGEALGYLFQEVNNPAEISMRLTLFEKVRRKRASRVQILSTVRVGKEREVQGLLQEYDEPGFLRPGNFAERTEHDFSFKLLERCDEILAAAKAIES